MDPKKEKTPDLQQQIEYFKLIAGKVKKEQTHDNVGT
jgi:hypothetical protein